MRVHIGSDHAGFELKSYLIAALTEDGHQLIDHGPEAYDGEPPARFEMRSARQLFDDISRDLDGVDILRVMHSEWLADGDFKREVETLIAAIQGRGGRVELR